MFTNDDSIHAHTRRQAVADGVLVDVSDLAREAGFRWPVAVTAAVWEHCIRVPDGVSGRDEAGRLWDVLTVLQPAIRHAPRPGAELRSQVLVRNDAGGPRPVPLKAVVGPDDQGKPCLTIMKRDED